MGFTPANFQFPVPFQSWFRVSIIGQTELDRQMDRWTDNGHQCLMLHPIGVGHNTQFKLLVHPNHSHPGLESLPDLCHIACATYINLNLLHGDLRTRCTVFYLPPSLTQQRTLQTKPQQPHNNNNNRFMVPFFPWQSIKLTNILTTLSAMSFFLDTTTEPEQEMIRYINMRINTTKNKQVKIEEEKIKNGCNTLA